MEAALSLRELEVSGKTRPAPFGYVMLQVSSSTKVSSAIPHRAALSVLEAANVGDVARALLTASLSYSGAPYNAVLVVEERALVPVVVSPSPSPEQLLHSAPSGAIQTIAREFSARCFLKKTSQPERSSRSSRTALSTEGQGGFTNPVDDAMTDTRITLLGGKEGEWNSTK